MASPQFTHLHVHSHYSLLDGLGKIDNILKATKDSGMDSIALTDHGVLYGAVEWYQKANEYGVKPIIGVEGYIAPNRLHQKRSKVDARPYHVTLLAKNEAGYKNLIKLVSIAHLEGYYYKPRVDYETLAKYSEGLICLSGCVNGHIPREILSGNTDRARELVGQYQKIFGLDNFYLEVQNNPTLAKQQAVNDQLYQFAKDFRLHTVATNDVHYVGKEDDAAHDILLCVQTGKKVNDTDRMSYKGLGVYLKSPLEMSQAFPDHPEVLENTQRIAEQCSFTLELGKTRLPTFAVPSKKSAAEYLRELCENNVIKRYGTPWKDASKEVRDRVEYELGIIGKTGFAGYFLIVQDFVNWSKKQGIVVGPGRGSAAGSIIAYLLFITDVDPLRWGLFFERFLNPARISPPDIDMDFDDARRDEVLEYVAKKYGRDRVAQIITFGTIKARNGIRDAGRVLGIPYGFCDRVAKMIPMKFGLDEALKNVAELRQLYEADPQAKTLIDSARKLEGVARHAGTHACGVVISDEPLNELVPCQFSTRGNETTQNITTQYELHAIESLGLLKMDFLGLSNLTIIQHTLDIINKRFGKRIDISALPLDDKKTFELLRDARTTGVFQLESSGMRRYLKELQPTELEDIVAMVALYRPGPMQYIPDYIQRKRTGQEPPYLHPTLKPILQKTYGIAVYQEQVMQIARDLAGFSLGEADLLRKAVGKKIKKLLGEQREKFIKGCLSQGVSKDVAQKVFAFIEPFAGYGFNRAHAVCYAVIAYQTAFLKANYPAEFMAALLRSDEDDIDRMAIEMSECHKMKIPVLPPSINQSFKHFTVINMAPDGSPLPADQSHRHVAGVIEGVRFGLAGVKNLGSDCVEITLQERTNNGPFNSLGDLLSRVPPSALNKKSLESLVKCGALDEFGERAAMLETIPLLLRLSREIHEKRNSKQLDLFGGSGKTVTPTIKLAEVPTSTQMQRLKWEKELLGLYVSAQPLAEHRQLIEEHGTPIGTLAVSHTGQRVSVVGLVTKIQKVITRSNEPMLFVQIDDFSGSIEALMFPSILRDYHELLVEDAVLTISGKLSDKDGTLKILSDKVEAFNVENFRGMQNLRPAMPAPEPAVPVAAPRPETKIPTGPRIDLMLEKAFSLDNLKTLKQKLESLPQGNRPVVLHIAQGSVPKSILTNFRIEPNASLVAELEQIVGKGRVQVHSS
jgi:DNA polymerase-3 subunit alpha